MVETGIGVDPGELAGLAGTVAREAGRLIVTRRAAGVDLAGTKSTPTDVVTRADHEAEELICSRLLAARPRDGLIGEETGTLAGKSGVTWIVDPIDGTVNYLYGIPTYAVSIAARAGDQVVAGAVVDPVRQETWTGIRGGGAFLDGAPIKTSGCQHLTHALVATGFGYAAPQRAAQADVLRELIVQVRDIRRAGVASIDLCSVACGRVDASYEHGLHVWDIAAGMLIAEEAGAVVGGLHGTPAGEDLVIAAAPGIFPALHDALAAASAARG